MSKWVKFRNSILGIFVNADIVNAGEFANTLDSIITSGNINISKLVNENGVEYVYDQMVKVLVDMGYDKAGSILLKETIIELIMLNKGLMDDAVKNKLNADYKSTMKKKAATVYATFFVNLSAKIIQALLEKYLAKQFIK